jgi:hypothetical protein
VIDRTDLNPRPSSLLNDLIILDGGDPYPEVQVVEAASTATSTSTSTAAASTMRTAAATNTAVSSATAKYTTPTSKQQGFHKNLKKAQASAKRAAEVSVELLNGGGGDDDDDKKNQKIKRKRMEVRNQDYVDNMDGLSKQLAANGLVTTSLARTMERALNNSQNTNSPSSRIMTKATACTDRVTQLKASRKKMMEDGDPQEEIDEVTASIKQYREMSKNLDKKLFDLQM